LSLCRKLQAEVHMKKIVSILILSILAGAGCNLFTPYVMRFENYDLRQERGITLSYRYTTPGLYRKPFIINFRDYLKKMSDGRLDLDSVNTYTSGNYEPTGDCKLKVDYSNFLDPECRFVNAWFGAYLIFDDASDDAKKFMLKDPSASPEDPANFNLDSIAMIPEMDQKLIVWSTHEAQAGYTWEQFEKDFFFNRKTDIVTGNFRDRQNRSWMKLTGEFETIAALTDTSKTQMGLTDSLRAYIGLPTADVYRVVDPWYTFRLKGSLAVSYYKCTRQNFWAIVYYNGAAFRTKDGRQIDTLGSTDIEREFLKMIDSLHLQCE